MSSLRSASKLRLTARSFSSSSSQLAPPKPAKTPNKKLPIWALKKGTVPEEESTAAGAGQGSVLSEVTQPKVDLAYLESFQPESLTPEAVGQVRAFSDQAVGAFKSFTIPPTIQKEFAFTPRPATVVRSTTLKTAAIVDASKKTASKDSRHVLTGPAGSGKSVLILQTVAYAQATGGVVLYIPSATPLVNSSTAHVYDESAALFDQPLLARQLLTKFAAANKAPFKAIKTAKEHSFDERVVKAGTSLEELVSKAVEDKTAGRVLAVLFEELAAQKTHPVLLALDDAQSLFATSSYVDPSYNNLESFALTVPRLLLSYISGAASFSAGSVLLAPSLLSKHTSPAFTSFLASKPPAAFTNVGTACETYAKTLEGVKSVEVPARLERREAVGVVEMLGAWRGVRDAVSDESFLERYARTGGNPRELTRSLTANVRL